MTCQLKLKPKERRREGFRSRECGVWRALDYAHCEAAGQTCRGALCSVTRSSGRERSPGLTRALEEQE